MRVNRLDNGRIRRTELEELSKVQIGIQIVIIVS